MERTKVAGILMVLIASVGIYMTVIGMMILYLDFPMNLEKMMNRDGVIFILMGVTGILVSDSVLTKIRLKKEIGVLKRVMNELYGGHISHHQRICNLESENERRQNE